MKREDPIQCATCEEALTVKHAFLYCHNYADTRTPVYEALGLDYENFNDILTFLKKPNYL